MKTRRAACTSESARTRQLKTAAIFGLSIDAPDSRHRARLAGLAAVAAQGARAIAGGGTLLVTGPSGSGKSTLLGLLAAHMGHVRQVCPERQLGHIRACVCTLSGKPLEEWLAHLARFGLGEAMLWLQRPGELSSGQRWRLAFALRMTGEKPCVMCDEFAALLDRPTAMALAMTLRRERMPGARLVLATSHDDLARALEPDVEIALGLDGRARVTLRQRLVARRLEIGASQAHERAA
jgi:uncharacterized protein